MQPSSSCVRHLVVLIFSLGVACAVDERTPLLGSPAGLDSVASSARASLTLGSPCSAEGPACGRSLVCLSSVCRAPCSSNDECGAVNSQAQCFSWVDEAGTTLLGCVTTDFCDPRFPDAPQLLGASACRPGDSCIPREDGLAECGVAGRGLTGATCQMDSDCSEGLFCGADGVCQRFCWVADDCGEGEICSSFPTPLRAGDFSIGYCVSTACDPVSPSDPSPGLSVCPESYGCRPAGASTASECVLQSGVPRAYEICSTRADCAPGYFCGTGSFSGVCNKYCTSDEDCPGERCATFSPEVLVAGEALGYCARLCNPAQPGSSLAPFAACPQGFGCTATTDGLSFCVPAGNGERYDTCDSSSDCRPGLFCGTDRGGYCEPYCLQDSDCGAGRCTPLPGNLTAGGREVGYCAEICDPVDPGNAMPPFNACPSGFRCVATVDGNSFCLPGGSNRFQACQLPSEDCAPGFACVDGSCQQYCFENADCQSASCSLRLSQAAFAADREVLLCEAP